MQRNTTAAQLRKTRESATTALNPGSEEGKCKQHTKNKGKRERRAEEEEEGAFQSHQCPHSQDREPELCTTNEMSKSWVRCLPCLTLMETTERWGKENDEGGSRENAHTTAEQHYPNSNFSIPSGQKVRNNATTHRRLSELNRRPKTCNTQSPRLPTTNHTPVISTSRLLCPRAKLAPKTYNRSLAAQQDTSSLSMPGDLYGG